MTDLRHRLALLLAAESERALTAEERLEQMTRERDDARLTFESCNRARRLAEEECDELRRRLAESRAEAAAFALRETSLVRELERWRHGVTIEGDFVCPHEVGSERSPWRFEK